MELSHRCHYQTHFTQQRQVTFAHPYADIKFQYVSISSVITSCLFEQSTMVLSCLLCLSRPRYIKLFQKRWFWGPWWAKNHWLIPALSRQNYGGVLSWKSALKLLGFFHVCSMLWPSDSRVKGKHFWYRDLSLWVIYFSFSTFVFAVLLFTHYLLVIKETRHEDKAGDGCVYRQMSAFRCWTIMLNQGRSCLSRNVLPTWRAGPWMIQNPGRALTSSLLKKKKKP